MRKMKLLYNYQSALSPRAVNPVTASSPLKGSPWTHDAEFDELPLDAAVEAAEGLEEAPVPVAVTLVAAFGSE